MQTTSKTTTNVDIAWADIQAWITSSAALFLSAEAKLSMGMIPSGSAAAGTPVVQVYWLIPPATLDAFLRAEISTLPPIGDYTVTLTSGDPVNAGTVTWTA
jgi:hypothetical protein